MKIIMFSSLKCDFAGHNEDTIDFMYILQQPAIDLGDSTGFKRFNGLQQAPAKVPWELKLQGLLLGLDLKPLLWDLRLWLWDSTF